MDALYSWLTFNVIASIAVLIACFAMSDRVSDIGARAQRYNVAGVSGAVMSVATLSLLGRMFW